MEGNMVYSWRKSFPPRTRPLQVLLENALLAALLAKRQQQFGHLCTFFLISTKILINQHYLRFLFDLEIQFTLTFSWIV